MNGLQEFRDKESSKTRKEMDLIIKFGRGVLWDVRTHLNLKKF